MLLMWWEVGKLKEWNASFPKLKGGTIWLKKREKEKGDTIWTCASEVSQE